MITITLDKSDAVNTGEHFKFAAEKAIGIVQDMKKTAIPYGLWVKLQKAIRQAFSGSDSMASQGSQLNAYQVKESGYIIQVEMRNICKWEFSILKIIV